MVIYVITNIVNGKQYVGQTSMSIRRRLQYHFLESNGCLALKRAIVKYGKKNFKIEEIHKAASQEELDTKEFEFIKTLETLVPGGYNLKDGGSKPTYSKESRAKMSNSQKGKKHSEETKRKMSKSHLGVKKHGNFSKVMSEVKSHLKIAVFCDQNGKRYESVSAASKDTGVHSAHISRILKGILKRSKGYTFKRA